MPYNLHVIHTNDFIRLDSTGGLDLEASKRVLANLARACVKGGVDCALVDLRRARGSGLTLGEVYRLALAFKEMGFQKHHRLAILHRYRAGEKADFFAMCAAHRGWHVRAFEDYEEAIDWFAEALPVDSSQRAGAPGRERSREAPKAAQRK